MIISHSKKFIYIHLEKCGGTSIENALAPYLSDGDLLFGSTADGDAGDFINFGNHGIRKVKNTMLWKHSTARQAYRYIGYGKWSQYRKISVVRDPITLGKSLFSFAEKVITFHIPPSDFYRWRWMVKRYGFPQEWPYTEDYVKSWITAYVNRTKFDGFIQDLIYKDYDCFSPYSERLKPSLWYPDFGTVVDLSQIDEKWPMMCEIMGIDAPPLPKLNASGSESLHISRFAEDAIRQRFAIDYENIPEYTGLHWN